MDRPGAPRQMQNETISQMIQENFLRLPYPPADSKRLLQCWPRLRHGQHSHKPLTQAAEYPGEDEMVGASPAMLSLFSNLRKIAGVEARYSSPAKAAPARNWERGAIHERSCRAGGPFVAVNCGRAAAQPDSVGTVWLRKRRLHRRRPSARSDALKPPPAARSFSTKSRPAHGHAG